MAAAALQSVASSTQLDDLLKASSKAVIFFWASWSAPCKHMQQVLQALAARHGGVAFAQVEAEEVDAVTERYSVTTVPTFVFVQAGKECGRLEGADAPGLTERVSQLAGEPAAAANGSTPAPAAAGDINSRIERLLASAPIVLFMKGNKAAPYCGFSRKVVDALAAAGATSFLDVDILQDEELRQGLKAYSNWPTYPQLYVGGELLGGCDIVLEMAASGELRQALQEKAPSALAHKAPAAPPAAAPAAPAAAPGPLSAQERARLDAAVSQQPVMLFMKGSPEAPRCGFSRKVVDALSTAGIAFGSFDILQDEGVRQGLKVLSNWPTYPQLYVRGELLGGCDIVLEMAGAGELKGNVDEMLHRMQEAD